MLLGAGGFRQGVRRVAHLLPHWSSLFHFHEVRVPHPEFIPLEAGRSKGWEESSIVVGEEWRAQGDDFRTFGTCRTEFDIPHFQPFW